MPFDSTPHSLDMGLPLLVERLAQMPAKVMLFGPPGSGKSTLATLLAQELAQQNKPCACLSADPGSPSFGVPAAINLGTWQDDQWQLQTFDALCSLNAARFRLPLVNAAQRLQRHAPENATLLIDMPGVVRGVAGAELLTALAETLQPDLLVVLTPQGQSPDLPQELASLPQEQLHLIAAEQAHQLPRGQRKQQRTALWDSYLQTAQPQELPLQQLTVLGTPPPLEKPNSWLGRAVALSDGHQTLTMGEVMALQHLEDDNWAIRLWCPSWREVPEHSQDETGIHYQLLIRDAVRRPGKPLATQEPISTPRRPKPTLVEPPHSKYPVSPIRVQASTAVAEMINGVFGDPLLLLRLQQDRRCLLFDLGDTSLLPLRCAHRVTDVFISHAHIDHIGGFIGLLRARLGTSRRCRLYGPPGLAKHIAGMLQGILWDRIGDEGPQFEIAELRDDHLYRCRLQAGIDAAILLPEQPVHDGIILRDKGFQIRTVQLDHHTPVLAFAFEAITQLHVDEQKLQQLALTPGPWLAQLKNAAQHDDRNRPILLPDGRTRSAGTLADQLLISRAGDKLVYATDLADTPDNQHRLSTLARDAHTLFCEASFDAADQQRASQHGHLTTLACGEIAAKANVQQLAPFHFSKRYEGESGRLYTEIETVFGRLAKG